MAMRRGLRRHRLQRRCRASRTVRTLAAKIPGVRAIDGGKLENARILEHITALLIGLNIRNKGHSGIRITGLPEKAYEGRSA